MKNNFFPRYYNTKKFFNSIHKDKSAVLSDQSCKLNLNELILRKKKNQNNNEDRYIHEIFDCNYGYLPKSTT